MKAVLLAAAVLLCAPPVGAEPLRQVKVTCDRAPDCSSLASIVQSVTRGCKTDDDRAIALYNFCRYDHYHFAYPQEPGGISALKLINVYGWSLCGGQHTVLAALWEAAGFRWRYRGWSRPGHTTVEAFYQGRWHYLDTFLKFYAWMPDARAPSGRTIAGQEDLAANPALLSEAFAFDPARKVWYQKDNRFDYAGDNVNWTAPAFLVCGDALDGVLLGVRNSHDSGSPRGWGGIRFEEDDYSTDVDLAVGYSLTLDWNRIDDAYYFGNRSEGPRHTCGDKDYRNSPAIGPILEPYHELRPERSWSNGTLRFAPDMANDALLDSLHKTENVRYSDGELRPAQPGRPGVVVVEMGSPYIVAKAHGKIEGDGVRTEVSTDLKQWKPIELAQLTGAVRGTYRYFIRATFDGRITAIELESIVQHNQEALPYLAPGDNTITVTASNPARLGNARLVVTYAYLPGHRELTPEQTFDRDAEIARTHFAHWSPNPVVVQREITQFPTRFEVPIATPKGRQPVYPRMLFLRREMLAPGEQPLPVPAPPSQPKVGSDQYLAAVPTPWLIGTGPPKPADNRPTQSTMLRPSRVSYASKQGEVASYQSIKWQKDNSNAWVLLVDFDLPHLGEPARLASATLNVYVHEAHDKAPMQAAAVTLSGPFEPGKPFDFSRLGSTLGTAIVQRGGGPGDPFVPPQLCRIDVTRAVRAWARGEPKHGLAVRIVPNRGIDDGWTVRFTPDKEKPVELLVETYSDQ